MRNRIRHLWDTVKRNVSSDVELVDQPTLRPTRKVTTEWVATAMTLVIITLAGQWFDIDLDPEVAATVGGAIAGVVGGVAAYFTKERAPQG